MSDDFKPIKYPVIVLPDMSAPLTGPLPATDIFDMPANERIIRGIDGRATGGFTRTGTYLTLHRNMHYVKVQYPGGIDDLPY